MSEEPRTKDPSGQASQVETTVHYSVLIDFYWENVFFPNNVSISVCILRSEWGGCAGGWSNVDT